MPPWEGLSLAGKEMEGREMEGSRWTGGTLGGDGLAGLVAVCVCVLRVGVLHSVRYLYYPLRGG